MSNIELKEISRVIGNNLDLIQGAGGNTSLKDNETLWIKASGCWLSDAFIKDIFVPVDKAEIIKAVIEGDISKIAIKKEQSSFDKSLRPSIETSLHALMPHKFVLHAHGVNTLSIAVLKNGKKYFESLLKDINWIWVPYVKPGIKLATKVHNSITKKVDVIILANHGLVVGGNSSQEALSLLNLVETRMNRSLRKTSSQLRKRFMMAISKSIYRESKYEIVNSIALDEVALKIAETGVLYPDHVVFLGAGPMKVLSIEEFEDSSSKLALTLSNSVVIVRDFGVAVHPRLSANAESMLYCLSSVLLRIQKNENLRYLTQEEVIELIDWDAEKYRKKIQK